MSNADKFLFIYNKVHKHLQCLGAAKGREDFTVLLGRLSGSNGVIRAYKNDLREYAELRNAIVHQTTEEVIIAEPHTQAVENFQKIYDIIIKPPTAYDIASKPVEHCNAIALIADVIRIMTVKVYTHIPVLEDGKFVGVFSEATVTRWLADSAEKDGFVLDKTQIGELKDYYNDPENTFCCYRFVSRGYDAYKIKDDFLYLVNKKWRLGAVFVTDSGKKTDKIIGIITSWDLPKIDEYGKEN